MDTLWEVHMSSGETPYEALMREAGEELGLNDFVPEFLGKYVWKSSGKGMVKFLFNDL